MQSAEGWDCKARGRLYYIDKKTLTPSQHKNGNFGSFDFITLPFACAGAGPTAIVDWVPRKEY